MNIEDQLKIQTVISRFANSFDVKDWSGLESCFTESLYTDYSDLHGAAPQTVTASNYVAARRQSLDPLNVHHLVSNYEITFIDSRTATCRASMIVWRKTESEEFTSHCVYIFRLTEENSEWKINGITQKILWNEGTASIPLDVKT